MTHPLVSFKEPDPKLGTKLGTKKGTKLCSKMGTKLCSKMGTKLGSKMGTKLGSKLGSKMGTKLGSKMGTRFVFRTRIGGSSRKKKKKKKRAGPTLWYIKKICSLLWWCEKCGITKKEGRKEGGSCGCTWVSQLLCGDLGAGESFWVCVESLSGSTWAEQKS